MSAEVGASAELGAKERLQVLLAEYNTLRSAQINRTNSAYQLIGFAIAGVGVAASFKPWVILPILIGLGVSTAVIISDMMAFNKRVAELEFIINEMVGKPLLIFEINGGGTFGRYWRKITPIIRSIFREDSN